jgi:DNA-binding NarL/FixJ family response regulator
LAKACYRPTAVKYKRERRLLLSIRILVVDDHEGWRRRVCQLLQVRPKFQVIGETSDGSEAVQMSEALRPDLIVLDIGLPKLNGIEAAGRMREVSPSSKIIFLSQNNDRDIVQAALSAGGLGYVHKTEAQSELLSAIDAVLRGKRFVSSSFKGHGFTDTSAETAPHRHEVQFYSDDAVFLDTFARFIAVALKSGDAVIAVITESHRESLVLRLKTQGLDVDAATQHGRYIPLDVDKTLATFMVNDIPDEALFFEVVGSLIEAAAKGVTGQHPRVVACGECSPLLWAKGKSHAAIRLEQLWDEVGKTFGVDILCGYSLSGFRSPKDQQVFQNICAEHSAVYSL